MKCSASSGISPGRSRSGGTEDGNDVQPEVEVFPESRGSDLGRQILVGRGQHAHVHPHACCPADRLDELLLKCAQDLRLRLQAHVADLIEKQRAGVGELELSAPIRGGARERSLDVSEQLALDQLFRYRGAVHLDERSRPDGGSSRGCSGRRAPCRSRSRRRSAPDRWSAPPSPPARAAAPSRSSRPPSSAGDRRGLGVRDSRPRAAADGRRCRRRGRSSRARAASRRSRTRPV